VFWQHTRNGVTTQILIANSAGKYSGGTVATPSLTINNAVFEDDGQYQCFAQNFSSRVYILFLLQILLRSLAYYHP
jgi:hypothetical protein